MEESGAEWGDRRDPQQEPGSGERRAAIQHWLNHLPATVVNRPGTGQANGSKPLQMARLAKVGLDIPPWCLTNDPVAVREAVE